MGENQPKQHGENEMKRIQTQLRKRKRVEIPWKNIVCVPLACEK